MKLLAAFTLLLPALAFADEIPRFTESLPNEYYVDGVNTSGLSLGALSESSVSKDQMIIDGLELGAELRLLSSPAIAITDVAFLTLRARKEINDRGEVFGTVDLLPKQPSTTDELVWQSASLGVNFVPGSCNWAKRHLALTLDGKSGVLVDRDGYWGEARFGARGRKEMHKAVRFEGNLSALGTQLRPDARDNTWLVETALGGSVLFHDPDHGIVGGWLGFNYSLPVAHANSLEPQPRLDLEIGSVLSFVKHWDLFARFVVIDRGDADQMATQLPVLDGGFDQKQLVFGVTWHSSGNASDWE
jgi:hypothetical protein